MPYETKPMKKQWITVEGRMTPIILPQIWNHELQDWVVTSEQNPLPTQVTGSIVEFNIVEQEEIRDAEIHQFPFSIPKGVKDFELIFNDTHMGDAEMGSSRRLGFSFGTEQDNRGSYGHLADDKIAYNWITGNIISYNSLRRFTTELPGGYGRNGFQRYNLTLTQMMLEAEYNFYNDYVKVDNVSFTDKHQTLTNLKKAILYSDIRPYLSLQIKDFVEQTSMRGSISVKFVGWK